MLSKPRKTTKINKNAIKPKELNSPDKKIKNLKELWNSKELNNIRSLHKQNRNDEIEICKNCSFKDTYDWVEI